MNTQDLNNLMDGFSGGSDGRTRHWAVRRFIYSEGMKAVADKAGCHWLLDIVATEVAPICMNAWESKEEHMHFLRMTVANDAADIWLERDDGEPRLWERHIGYTDFPEGEWTFYLGIDQIVDPGKTSLVMFLPQEH